MTRKQLGILVVALLVLAAAGAWLAHSQRMAWTTTNARIGQKLLASLKLADVAEVVLSDGSHTVTLAKDGSAWVVKERANFRADAQRMRALLIRLVELRIVQTEPVAKSQLGRLDLIQPGTKSGSGKGTLLQIKNAKGKVLARLLLGKKVMARTNAPGAAASATGRYVLAGSDTDNAELVSDPLDTATAKPVDWLFKDLIRAERIDSIDASGPDGKQRFSISRKSESADWKLAGGGKLDQEKAEDAASALESMTLKDVVADHAAASAGMEKPVLVTAHTLDGLTYTVRIGKETKDKRYFVGISVAGEPPATRVAPKKETAKEKKKQDKAFADKRARLMKRLKWEKTLDRWTYLVDKSAVEPLLRERAQLLSKAKKNDS